VAFDAQRAAPLTVLATFEQALQRKARYSNLEGGISLQAAGTLLNGSLQILGFDFRKAE
jgi:hypothetical protein